ncbi:methyltransferase [Diplogelasinospora grovesii]|uniref:Methyltransferase n=1 Tax=Diplogelasinospora grovesii TaxID=303347 RepID=A0AAN6N5T5_9PEZI|nr:methyltransferase [Diplogelasinospora grovesii]
MTSRSASWGTYIYTSISLRFYDAYVLGFNMRYIWGCATYTILLPLFCENFSKRHLDIGVATGYFPSIAIERSREQDARHITLMDLNKNSLHAAEKRIKGDHSDLDVDVQCVYGDVLGPLPDALKEQKFDSISLFNLFHCVPGTPERKAESFATLAQCLSDDGVLVGNTVLGKGYMGWSPLTWYTMFLFNYFFRSFTNWEDNPEAFEAGLRREFEDVQTWIVGSMFLFRARKPRRN